MGEPYFVDYIVLKYLLNSPREDSVALSFHFDKPK